MAWFRVDDNFLGHPKVHAACAALGGRTQLGRLVAVWLEAGLWSSRNLTDGLIPFATVSMFVTDTAPAEVLDACATGGLAHKTEAGYQLHDWEDYNPSGQQLKDRRQKDRDRKRREAADASVSGPSAMVPRGLLVSQPEIPPLFHADSARKVCGTVVESRRNPDGSSADPVARAGASGARVPHPHPHPLQEHKAEEQRALPARAMPQRMAFTVWEVRRHLLAAVHLCLDQGAPFVDAGGQPNYGELSAELKVIAGRLGATWDVSRELNAIIEAAVARRRSIEAADAMKARFTRREARAWQRLGGVR